MLKTLKVFLYFPVMLFDLWSLGTCLQEILIQCSNTHAPSIGQPTQPLNCQRLGTWWRPQRDEGSNRLAPRLLIPCARCLHWSLEQMLGPQNYWRNQWLPRKQTQFYIIEQLFRHHPIAHFKAGLLYSFLLPLFFLFPFFFIYLFFCTPIEAAAPHYNCGGCIRGQAKQSSHCSAQICSVCLHACFSLGQNSMVMYFKSQDSIP